MDNGINVAGASAARQVSFQAGPRRGQVQASNPYQEKKDGDKKLLLALGGLAAIATGVYLVKSGKGKQAVDAVKTHFSKNAGDAADALQEGGTKAKEKLSQATQAKFDKYKSAIGDLSKAGAGKQAKAEELFEEVYANSNKLKRGLAGQQAKVSSLQADLAELGKKGDRSGAFLDGLISKYGFDTKAFEGMNCPQKQKALTEKVTEAINKSNGNISRTQRVLQEYDSTLASIVKSDGVIQQGKMLTWAKTKQQAQQMATEVTSAITGKQKELTEVEALLKGKFKPTGAYATKADAQAAKTRLTEELKKLGQMQTMSKSGLTIGDIEGAKTLFTTGKAKTGWGGAIATDFFDQSLSLQNLTKQISDRQAIVAKMTSDGVDAAKIAAFEKKSLTPLLDKKTAIEEYFTKTTAPIYSV